MLDTMRRTASVVVSSLLFTLTSSFTPVAFTQTFSALDMLIFDPVLLDESVVTDPSLKNTNARELDTTPLTSNGYSLSTLQKAENMLETAEQDEIATYLDAIQILERTEGLYTQALVQNYLSVGELYQQRDNHELAIEFFEKADHISRVNNGLYHSDQFPIIEGMIESHLALSNVNAALNNQRYLLYLNNRLSGSGSLEALPSLIGLGDRDMNKFSQSMLTTGTYQVNQEQIKIPAIGAVNNWQQEIIRQFALRNLSRAKNTYFDAITTLVDNEEYRNPKLQEVEYKFLETIFLLGFSPELIKDPHYYLTQARRSANMLGRWTFLRRNLPGYQTGNQILERLQSYVLQNPATTAEESVNAVLETGDWQLLFDRTDAAVKYYQEAYTLAQELELDNDVIESIFKPRLPLQLPLFTPKPNSREKFGISANMNLEYDGFIDIAFSINRNGTARKFRIQDRSDGTSFLTEKRLRQYLRNSPFRPWFEDDKPVSRELTMRYYYIFL